METNNKYQEAVKIIKAIQSEMEKEIYFHKLGIFQEGAKERSMDLIAMLDNVKKEFAHLLPEDDTPEEYKPCGRCGVASGWCICFE